MDVFYAHAASASPKETKEEVDLLSESLIARVMTDPRLAHLTNVRVRSGRSDHSNNWKGSWDDWQYSVVHRTNLTTGKPVYDLFVVSGTTCGKATATILQLALRAKRPVFWWSGKVDGTFYRVTEIGEEDCEDWTNGWFIIHDQPKQLPLPFPKEASQ